MKQRLNYIVSENQICMKYEMLLKLQQDYNISENYDSKYNPNVNFSIVMWKNLTIKFYFLLKRMLLQDLLLGATVA